jgi:hypothetical protein
MSTREIREGIESERVRERGGERERGEGEMGEREK